MPGHTARVGLLVCLDRCSNSPAIQRDSHLFAAPAQRVLPLRHTDRLIAQSRKNMHSNTCCYPILPRDWARKTSTRFVQSFPCSVRKRERCHFFNALSYTRLQHWRQAKSIRYAGCPFLPHVTTQPERCSEQTSLKGWDAELPGLTRTTPPCLPGRQRDRSREGTIALAFFMGSFEEEGCSAHSV